MTAMTLNAASTAALCPEFPRSRGVPSVCATILILLLASSLGFSQGAISYAPSSDDAVSVQVMRSQRFVRGRTSTASSAAEALDLARGQHLALLNQRALSPMSPQLSPLSAAWQSLGPNQVASVSYGDVTGRISSIAIDPGDPTGNTVYLGTTGGGVWKSTNAAGGASSVTFVPLTDTLPVFSGNAGSAAIPSISIGAVSVQSGIILAGTGDPNDASDSYYGDGVLRSTDGGLTWTLIRESQDGTSGNHSFLGLGFAGFAWSSLSPNLVVAALSQSAEGDLVNTPLAANRIMGLYYSTDAGATWQMATIQDGSQIVQTPLPAGSGGRGNAATAVVWNPIRQRFYAAVRYHGYYQSADGVTWTRLPIQPGSGLTLTACPTNPNLAGSPGCPIFRGALAVQPLTGDTFALTADANDRDQGLWQDVCGLSGSSCGSAAVLFGRQLPSAALEVGSGSTVIPQADYNLALAAVADGPDTLLFAGTTDLYRCSLAAGCVMRNTTNALNGCAAPAMVAPAQHAIGTLFGGLGKLVYVGNDGGLWRSTDGVAQKGSPCSQSDATHFENLNVGLGSLAEIIHFDQDPTDSTTLLAGLGANGTAGTSSAGSTTPWPQLSAGEGGFVAIDQVNAANWYLSTAGGVSIRQCTLGAACTASSFSGVANIGPAQTADDVSALDAPWILDPALPSNVVVGTCRAWRGPGQGGALWSSANAISKPLGGPANATCGAASNPVIRSLAAGGTSTGATAAQSAGSSVLYAGLAGSADGGGNYGGHIFTTRAAGAATNTTAWADLAGSPVTNDVADQGVFNPGGFDISSIAADAHDATGLTVYATVMGFSGNGINAPHLYRSTDGGAHWINISSNLPNAPANSVIVDPNDANTLYVALDTGVYVTTQVTTCSAANCWSVLGTALPNAPVVQLAAAAAIPTGDGRTGVLRAATYGRGIWQVPLLTAISIAKPALTLTPGNLTFATQSVGTESAAQSITVTSTGNAPLTVSQVTASGDFVQTNACIPGPVAVNATCTITVSFLPTVRGSRNGILTVYANVPGGQGTVTLSGTGAPPAAVLLNPITMTFPSTSIGATSAVQNITVSNAGGISATLHPPSITGDFSISGNTCGASLAPSTGCTVSILFAPTASGARSGIFSISDDAGTQTTSLLGTGTSPATDALSPLTLSFPAQQLMTASAAQQVTLTNAGDVALTLIAAQITSGDFSVVNACGNSLNGHSTCSLAVSFIPTAVGTRTGVLAISDQFRSQTVLLGGVGVAPPGVSVSPTGILSFAALAVGLTSGGEGVTLTNNGGLPLSLQSIATAGDFAIAPGSNTCGATLAPSTACTLQVTFTPRAGGARAGTLTISDNAANSPQTVSLTGTGVDFTLTPNGSPSVTVTAGSSAVFPLLLASAANIPGAATFTCAGVPAHATCTVSPVSAPLGGTSTISVTVATSVAGASLGLPPLPDSHKPIWLACGLPLGLLLLKRRFLSRSGIALLSLLAVTIMVTGCGSGRKIPDAGIGTDPINSPTPPGTYAIVVTASSAGLSHSVNLALVVQ